MRRRDFLCGAALALASPIAHSQATPKRVRYGGDAAFAPFEYLDADGKPAGFQIELLAALASEMGVEFDINLAPWQQIESDFRAGRLDLAAMVDTTERRKWARFTHGHATPALSFYFRRGAREPNGLNDLDGLRIAVPDTEAMRDTLRKWLAGVPGTFVRFPDVEQALAAVRDKQADIGLLPRAYADRQLASDRFNGLSASHQILPLQTYAFALSPENEALATAVQAALERLEADGRLEALRVRWLSSHREIAQRLLLERVLVKQTEWTFGVAGVSALALAALGFGVWRHRRIATLEKARRHGAEMLMRHAFELHADAMVLFDRTDRIVRDANVAMLNLVGVKAEEVIGQPLSVLDRHCEEEQLRFLMHTLDLEGSLNGHPLRVRRTDGVLRDCLITGDILEIGASRYLFCVVRDITEQLAADQALRRTYEQMGADLREARKELETTREAKALAENRLQEFTRSVAHDLKTPVNAVQSFSGLLHQRLAEGDVQEAARYSAHIERAARRMAAMIDALSLLAQVGRAPLVRNAVDMAKLAQETWSLVSAADPARQVQVRIGTLPIAQADADLVAQIWQNLLGNAWKYTAHNTDAAVLIDSHQDERGTWYRVTDNGDGFDMTKAKLLFHPFQRMHAGNRFEGSGVGLSLVRRMVEHHGGEVRVRSTPNVGTIAEFTLEAKGSVAGR